MKQISMRTKLVLWYTIILFLAANIIYGAIFLTVDTVMTRQSSENVIRSANQLAEKLHNGSDHFDIAEEDDVMSSGILFALYSHNGDWLDGNTSAMNAYSIRPGEIREVHDDHQHMLMYDMQIETGIIRVMQHSSEQSVLNRMLLIWLISVIPVMLLALLGGRIIAVGAMGPVRKITKAAQQLSKGDLSGRIELNGQRDEIGKLAETFNNMAENLQKAFARETQFSSDASHEMRTPVTIIIASAEDAANDDTIESYRNSNKIILSKAKELQKLISQLLTLARIGEQRESMVLEEINLKDILKNIAQEAEEWAKEKNISITTELNDCTAKVDLMMFTRMMVNLLDNAVNYSDNGSKVSIHLICQNNNAVITVTDNGQGISKDDLPHIFERFYRADKSRTDRNSGLGLSYVDMIVKLHQGTVSVNSEKGKGTTFTISLPLD